MVTCSDGDPHHWVIAQYEDQGQYSAHCQKCGAPRTYPGLEYQLDEDFSRLQRGTPSHLFPLPERFKRKSTKRSTKKGERSGSLGQAAIRLPLVLDTPARASRGIPGPHPFLTRYPELAREREES